MNRKRFTAGVLFLVGWFFLFRSTLASLYHLAVTDNGHSHLLAIPLLASFFLFTDRKRIFNTKRTNPGLQRILAGLFLATGFVLFLTGRSLGDSMFYPDSLSLSMAAALFLLLGIILAVVRDIDLSASVFPGVLLLLLVPIPTVLRDALVGFLIKGTVAITEVLFRVTGTTFYRDGGVFLLPGISIEIADVCSGIRSSIGLLITVLLAGHLFLKRIWSKGVLLATVIPFVLIKNALRVTALTLLSIHVDSSFLDSSLHHTYGGMAFFALTLILMYPILLLLRKLEMNNGNKGNSK